MFDSACQMDTVALIMSFIYKPVLVYFTKTIVIFILMMKEVFLMHMLFSTLKAFIEAKVRSRD